VTIPVVSTAERDSSGEQGIAFVRSNSSAQPQARGSAAEVHRQIVRLQRRYQQSLHSILVLGSIPMCGLGWAMLYFNPESPIVLVSILVGMLLVCGFMVAAGIRLKSRCEKTAPKCPACGMPLRFRAWARVQKKKKCPHCQAGISP
jgi:hypothetical protein